MLNRFHESLLLFDNIFFYKFINGFTVNLLYFNTFFFFFLLMFKLKKFKFDNSKLESKLFKIKVKSNFASNFIVNIKRTYKKNFKHSKFFFNTIENFNFFLKPER